LDEALAAIGGGTLLDNRETEYAHSTSN